MEFAEFAERAAAIEAEPADLEIVDLVTDLLAVADDDLPVVARFVQGRVFPGWDSTKLDVGPNLCYEAIARAAGTNVTTDDVEDRLAEVGEIGEVAASYDLGGQTGLGAFGDGGADALTVGAVADQLSELAAASGAGSQDRKLDLLFDLFKRADPEEARYIARLVLSEMRIGVGEGTVRDAIAAAFDVPVGAVERALQVSNDYGRVAEVARDEGEAGLSELTLEVGRPVKAMLAQAGTVADALDDWETAAVEWKYDGARVQVHYGGDEVSGDGDEASGDGGDEASGDGGNGASGDDGNGASGDGTNEASGDGAEVSGGGTNAASGDGAEVSVFSRNMEDVTDPLPEVVEFVSEHLRAPAIVDGEVVAVGEDGDPLPFQEILRRFRRKHDVAQAREEVAVEFHAFDCLHAGGDDLMAAPLVERHERLTEVLDAGVSELHLLEDPEEIAAVEEASLEAGHEGIMLKNPESAYTPGRRGKNWLKRKPDVETLDLVVTGAEWGEGRRASFLGTFLLSAPDGDGGYETLGKVATGITDEELAELTELLEPHIRSEEGQEVDMEPAVVFEVGYEEIQASPTYSSGYALRFPRFVGVRSDLDPEDADPIERVERLAEG